jgi:hypothetical protein
VKPPFKVKVGSSRFEHKTEENLQRRKLNTENSETGHYKGGNFNSRNIKQVPHCISVDVFPAAVVQILVFRVMTQADTDISDEHGVSKTMVPAYNTIGYQKP